MKYTAGNTAADFRELERLLEDLRRDPGGAEPPSPRAAANFARFAEYGYPVIGRDVAAHRIEEVRTWIRNIADAGRSGAVFMDTTTITAVADLVLCDNPTYITSETLLDLANFVSAGVLGDHIFHLKNKNLDSLPLNDLFGGEPVVIEIPIDILDLDGPGGLLITMWQTASSVVESLGSRAYDQRMSQAPAPEREEVDQILHGWRSLLGKLPGDLDIFNTRIAEDYESPGPALIKQLTDLAMGASDTVSSSTDHWPNDTGYAIEPKRLQQLGELISECHHRYVFNKIFCQAAQIPYSPNAYRAPFQQWRMGREWVVARHLATAEYIDEEYRQLIAKRLVVGPTDLKVPLFLTVILNRISNLSEFGEELAKVRDQARPLRERMTDLDQAIMSGNLHEIEGLRGALKGDTLSLMELIGWPALCGAIAAVLPGLSDHPTANIVTAAAALTYMSQYPRDLVQKLKERMFRPERRFLVNAANTANGMANAHMQIAKLWRVPEDYTLKIVRRLNRLRDGT
jgi:hypothetical protein